MEKANDNHKQIKQIFLLIAVLFLLVAYWWPVISQATERFGVDLRPGDRGVAVKTLQILLGLPNATGYFGSQTKQALEKFQLKHQVEGETGYLGPQTREVFDQVFPLPVPKWKQEITSFVESYNTQSQKPIVSPKPVVTKPYISSISPTSGRLGQTITIHGSGFSPTGNKIYTGAGIIEDIASSDGKQLSFTLAYPSGWQEKLVGATASNNQMTVPFWIYVENSVGLSNPSVYNANLP